MNLAFTSHKMVVMICRGYLFGANWRSRPNVRIGEKAGTK
jgi:hypothetical protein